MPGGEPQRADQRSAAMISVRTSSMVVSAACGDNGMIVPLTAGGSCLYARNLWYITA
jgi:hypothetical protein